MEKRTRIIPELPERKQSVFEKGLRIVEGGIWWYFMMYVVVVVLYWFDVLAFLYGEFGQERSDLVQSLGLAYLVVLIFCPAFVISHYKSRKQKHDSKTP